MPKAAIFDLDGTLVDSFQAHYLAWNETYEDKFGFSITREEFKQYFGGYPPDIMKDILEEHGEEFSEDVYQRLTDEKQELFRGNLDAIEVLPGVKRLLRNLKKAGVWCAVASNNTSRNIKELLSAKGLEGYFEVTVSATEVDNPKPAPDLFLHCAEELDVKPDNSVVFEDSVLGVHAGLNAEMKTVAVLTGEADEEKIRGLKPTMVLEDFTEVNWKIISDLYS